MTISLDSGGGYTGVSWKGSSETSIHNIINTSACTFYAPLKSSLILSKGTGDPTWSRATKAWGFNELGYLEELPSGCAFFGGARLVRNLVPTPSNTLAVAGTKTVTLTQAATLQFSMGAGAGTATFSGTGGASGTLAAGANRVSVNKTVTAGTFIVTASVDALVDLSIVDVTNYDASYVPEYVSVGVEASPYFGAGIDGAKYFETDWQGAPIAAANLLGFRREAAATNNLLHSRDLSNAAWTTKTNITAAKTATGLDGLVNTATTLTATAADAIILQPITLASAARCASAYVKRRTGTGTISFTQDGGSTWTDITAQINDSAWSRVQITSTLADPSTGFKISTSGDEIDVDVVQNEAGAEDTSPIITTTATVTRSSDSLTYQTAGNIDFSVGTLCGEIQTQTGASTRQIAGIGTSYSGITNNGVSTWRAYDGTTIVTKNGLSDIRSALRKRVISWGGAGLTSTGDGLVPAVGVFSGTFAAGANMVIGSNANGYIRNVAIYNYQMTDAELQAITS